MKDNLTLLYFCKKECIWLRSPRCVKKEKLVFVASAQLFIISSGLGIGYSLSRVRDFHPLERAHGAHTKKTPGT